MSRIGKKPIPIPKDVKIDLKDQKVSLNVKFIPESMSIPIIISFLF